MIFCEVRFATAKIAAERLHLIMYAGLAFNAFMIWSERVPWIEASDDLPKHDKGLQHAAQYGSKLLK